MDKLPTNVPLGEESSFGPFDPSGRFFVYYPGTQPPVVVELPACRLLGSAPISGRITVSTLAPDVRRWLVQHDTGSRTTLYDRAGKVLLEQLWEQNSALNPAFSPDLDGATWSGETVGNRLRCRPG